MTEYRTLSVEIDTKERFKQLGENLDDNPTQSELLDRLIESYQFDRLRQDKRVRETIEAIAADHDMEPSDVSLEAAFKVAAGAYNGFARTDDWDIQGESHA